MEQTTSSPFSVRIDDDGAQIHLQTKCLAHECPQALVLRDMRNDDVNLSDISLVGVSSPVGSTTSLPIRAHKLILIYASAHLRDLLTSEGYTDSRQPVCAIEHVDHESLRRIVEFIYTGRLTINADNAVDEVRKLLIGADYLMIKPLFGMCETFLADDGQIKLAKCVQLWCFARKYQCLTLMHATSVFIAKHLQDMPKDAEFLRMPYADCAKLLLSEAMVITANADRRCLAAIAWLEHDSVNRVPLVGDIVNMVPLIYGLISAETIYEAHESDRMREHAPDTIRKLTAGSLKKMKTAPVVSAVCPVKSNSCNSWFVLGGNDSHLFLKYDVKQRLWSTQPCLPWQRTCFGACIANDKIIAMGGYKNGVSTSDIDEYDLTWKTWAASSAKLSKARFGLAACSFRDQAFVLDGTANVYNHSGLDVVEKYDSHSKEIFSINKLRSARSFCAAAVARDDDEYSILLAGGHGRFNSGVMSYDLSTHSGWCTAGSWLKTGNRAGLAVAVTGNDFYLIGGQLGEGPTTAVEIYNSELCKRKVAPNLIGARAGCSATTIDEGNVVCVVGGYGYEGVPLKSVETFDVREGKWSTGKIVPDMPTATYYFGFVTV